MSCSSAPLSTHKRPNESDAHERSKKEGKRPATAGEAAGPAEAAAPAPPASSAAAKLSTQELYESADPARAIRPVNAASTKWQYQLHVRCEGAKVGFLTDDETQDVRYNNDTFAYRDLVMSGNAFAFDLVKTLLTAFGLSDSPFNHANGLGALDVGYRGRGDDAKVNTGDGIMMLDVQTKYDEAGGPYPFANDLIRGLHTPSVPASRTSASLTSAQLKSVKLCQLLDKPKYSTATRSSDTGVRTSVFLTVIKPERVAAAVSKGGALEAAPQALFEFSVTLEAIGTKEDMASDFQARFPRCVGGSGKVHGGNEIDDDDDDEFDELNVQFNNGRQVQGLFGWGGGDNEDAVYSIRSWLRLPLFEVDEEEGVARCNKSRFRL